MVSLLDRATRAMGLATPVRRANVAPAPPLRVVEGVSGVWFYHLATQDRLQPLCDPSRLVMQTGIPLAAWGHRVGHLPEKYCDQCAEHAARMGVALGDAAR